MILIVDNNDSFTFNIVESVRSVTKIPFTVVKSSNLSIEEVSKYQMIILSPGPSLPKDFPILNAILETYHTHKPILGICLGHQAICSFYGAKLFQNQTVMHGYDSLIMSDSDSILFKGIHQMTVGRYHSWYAGDIPSILKITARDSEGIVMGVEHQSLPVYGVQFHPESYITQYGNQIIKNFIDAASF
ncbi:MAG TPA: aminodeoxychorismate/anthranilate synthase component II [Bacteroidales bacterium]|nr:aminodeoxychorismate/anthranilate synthase component II [Bacteroidales bacterium]HPS71653.1 aminodeoxychorismate/anthranilate synthase component II [Bacteroidales bacterium]